MEENHTSKSKEDLLLKIRELEKEVKKLNNQIIKDDRYGLNWIDVPEGFEQETEDKIPILEEVKDKAITNDDGKPTHILIEGDNYHALTCLNYTHKGKVDVIYIDPPYNTGNDGFTYKDKRFLKEYPNGQTVPKEHPLRHSYWLSFMSKRLKLAKELLSDNGVIFISIDDNEVAQLKLLCDNVFGEDNLGILIWRKSGIGRDGKMKNTTTFRIDHEYILVGFKNNKRLNKSYDLPNWENEYSNPDNDYRGNYKAGSISRKPEASNPNHKWYYTVKTPSGKEITRQFEVSKEEFIKLQKDNRIYWGKKGDAVPSVKIFVNERRYITTSSIIDDKSCTTTIGSKEIEEILDIENVGEKMRPKPTSLLKKIFQISTKENSIVIDFFAGSGTSLEALMQLNNDYGGNRQCILVQQNENNICEEVCYERNKRVIQGYTNSKGEEIEGLGNSLKYYRTSFVGKHSAKNSTDDDRVELSHKAGYLLALGENTLEEKKKTSYFQIFDSKDKATAIYFKEDLSGFDEFVKEVEDIGKRTVVYIFSWDNAQSFEYNFEHLKEIEIKSIPQAILEIYKSIND